MTRLICGWCRKEFHAKITRAKAGGTKDASERSKLFCPHCWRNLPSSKIESTGNVVGRKHFHKDYKDGDVA